ncbi:MAG: HlyD family secretion protein [Planctomycetes bacterium]|nr:HlyD family secretion protein [Planctomycetota bacterium]
MTTATTAEPGPKTTPRSPRRIRRILVILTLLAVAIGAGYWLWTADIEATDDAFVEADVYQINSKVPGRLAEVRVAANEVVEAGQVLAVIEAADYRNAVAKAEADVALRQAEAREAELEVDLVRAATDNALAAADAEVAAADARLEQANADLAAAAAEQTRSSQDRERYAQLSERAVSRQRLAAVEADATSADANLRAAHKHVDSARAEVTAAKAHRATAESDRARVAVAEALVQQRRAELAGAEAALEQARLDLRHTTITSPAAGRVTRKTMLPGTFVQAGQSLMAIVSKEVYVVANFKETQLRRMRPGQHAEVHIDAYGVSLPAHVESIQAGSGAAFSLLPPENATGNYVKVVQRVPVRLLFDTPPDAGYTLGPGMSVVPEVTVR